MIPAAIDLTTLVELTAADADILIFCLDRTLDKFPGRRLYVIYLTQRFKKDQYDSGRGRQTANRQSTLNDTAEATHQRIALTQFEGSSTQIVGPVIFFVFRYFAYMPLCSLFKL